MKASTVPMIFQVIYCTLHDLRAMSGDLQASETTVKTLVHPQTSSLVSTAD